MNLAVLKRSINYCAAWKGGITGDAAAEVAHDHEERKLRKAVRDAERLKREHAELVNALRELHAEASEQVGTTTKMRHAAALLNRISK